MEHTAKGKPKIFDELTLPLGGMRCVNTIITEMCVLQIGDKGMVYNFHKFYCFKNVFTFQSTNVTSKSSYTLGSNFQNYMY